MNGAFYDTAAERNLSPVCFTTFNVLYNREICDMKVVYYNGKPWQKEDVKNVEVRQSFVTWINRTLNVVLQKIATRFYWIIHDQTHQNCQAIIATFPFR